MSSHGSTWTPTFAQLETIASSNRPIDKKLALARGVVVAQERTLEEGPLRDDVRLAVRSLDKLLDGDASGMLEQFFRVVRVDPRDCDRPRFFFFVVDGLYSNSPSLQAMLCRIQGRVAEQHAITRSEDFMRPVAARLGIPEIPPEIRESRLQGVEILQGAGNLRYAVFSDFLFRAEKGGANSRGGFVLSTLVDDFLEKDVDVAKRVFPRLMRRLESLDLLRRERLLWIIPLFVGLHDMIGHSLPFPLDHWAKMGAGEFLLHPFDDLGGDAEFFWMATAPEMRSRMLQLVSAEELAVWPYLWLMKRFCHYVARDFASDREHGALMRDSDARVGVLLWNYLRDHGAIVQLADGSYDFDDAEFARAAQSLLDDWVRIDLRAASGVEAYAAGVAEFGRLYGARGALDGRWRIPSALQERFALGAA